MSSIIDKDSLIVTNFKDAFFAKPLVDTRMDRVTYETIYPTSGIGSESDTFTFLLPKYDTLLGYNLSEAIICLDVQFESKSKYVSKGQVTVVTKKLRNSNFSMKFEPKLFYSFCRSL